MPHRHRPAHICRPFRAIAPRQAVGSGTLAPGQAPSQPTHCPCYRPILGVTSNAFISSWMSPMVGGRTQDGFAAQYPAHTHPCRRLRHGVAAAPPRLGAGSGRHCLAVWVSHLPAARQVHYSPPATGASPRNPTMAHYAAFRQPSLFPAPRSKGPGPLLRRPRVHQALPLAFLQPLDV